MQAKVRDIFSAYIVDVLGINRNAHLKFPVCLHHDTIFLSLALSVNTRASLSGEFSNTEPKAHHDSPRASACSDVHIFADGIIF